MIEPSIPTQEPAVPIAHPPILCEYCQRDVSQHAGCAMATYRLGGGTIYERIRYGEEYGDWVVAPDLPCYGCGCPPGTWHHAGCDAEICPRCGGQAVSCPCLLNGG